MNNDAYALWSDFLKVSDDLVRSTNDLVLSPQTYLALKGLTDEEVTSKNKAATEQALRNLVRAFAKQ